MISKLLKYISNNERRLSWSFIVFFMLVISLISASFMVPRPNYVNYHKSIINAEEEFFLNNNQTQALQLFDSIFKSYDFVFIDDCLEAFQLAVLVEKNDFAMSFLQKAIQNGFEPRFLKNLNAGCPCNFYNDDDTLNSKVGMFFSKNKKQILANNIKYRKKYLSTINGAVLDTVLRNHTLEQYVKDIYTDEQFKKVSDNNLNYILKQYDKFNFLGERNLGLPSDSVIKWKSLSFENLNDLKLKIHNDLKLLDSLRLRRVPLTRESSYFDHTPFYVILYHNKSSFARLKKYSNIAIKRGYLHPREYCYLDRRLRRQMDLRFTNQQYKKPKIINVLREKYLIPSWEIDSAKHAFAHHHKLKLNFGFFNASK